MSTWGRKCDASPGAWFGLPFLLVFDVATDDVGDIGVLFFLFLDEGVVVERLVHLDLFLLDFRFLLDPSFRGRGLLGGALRLGIGLFERDGLDLLRLGCGSLLRNWRARCDRAGRPYRPGRHHDLIHRPAFRAVNRNFVQIIEFSGRNWRRVSWYPVRGSPRSGPSRNLGSTWLVARRLSIVDPLRLSRNRSHQLR